ncbi:MAG TPA: galactitol-1-phosphate 5-dehydrogenase [Roseiflexaceae bacterium]|nr:galactitol-1-phosphate 5-dehydrogenase [Roseiflexaceae bacterium]
MQVLMYEGPWQMPLREIDAPVAGANDVIVKVEAVGICGSDVHGFTGSTGRRTPGIVMGHEVSGTISALGSAVRGYHIGDRVIIQPQTTCGSCRMCLAGRSNICEKRTMIGMHTHGAYAEAVRVPSAQLYRMPDGLSWEHGALVEPLAVALHAVNCTPLNLMESVVIVGAGPIGLLALLGARLKGAGKIIVTDRSKHRLALAKQLGADLTVNVAEEDAVATVLAATEGRGAHAAIEAVGITPTVQQALAMTRIGGHVTWIGNSAPEVTLNMQQVVTREITIRGVYGFGDEFGQAIHALSSGALPVAPLIEQVAPFHKGPPLFDGLARGTLETVKIILRP